MADIADYNHEPTIDPRRLRLRPNRPAVDPEPTPELEADDIADPYGVGVEALVAVDVLLSQGLIWPISDWLAAP